MKIHVVEDYAKLSLVGADILASTVAQKPDCVLGLATGETPLGLYDLLVKKHLEGLDFSRVKTVNLDEYYPLAPDNEQSYRAFMNKNLFDKINVDLGNTHVPDGLATDVDAFCQQYEELIDSLGGIDVQLLGIGRNGHIGFNEPADGLYPYTHLTALHDNTIQANARFFECAKNVPKHAITMGMASIFKAKRIVLLASGKEKAEAIKAIRAGRITTDCPATLLHLHPDVTLICDKAAYGEI